MGVAHMHPVTHHDAMLGIIRRANSELRRKYLAGRTVRGKGRMTVTARLTGAWRFPLV